MRTHSDKTHSSKRPIKSEQTSFPAWLLALRILLGLVAYLIVGRKVPTLTMVGRKGSSLVMVGGKGVSLVRVGRKGAKLTLVEKGPESGKGGKRELEPWKEGEKGLESRKGGKGRCDPKGAYS